MISGKSALELGSVAAQGGSLEVDGRKYTALELGGVAAQLIKSSHLKVHNSDKFTALEMGAIAARKPGQIIFC